MAATRLTPAPPGYDGAMMTMLGAMTTTPVLITAEIAAGLGAAMSTTLGLPGRGRRSWLQPAHHALPQAGHAA